ncbi:MAG: hypothetical protein V7641_4323 [Blastocatellia bacterium]
MENEAQAAQQSEPTQEAQTSDTQPTAGANGSSGSQKTLRPKPQKPLPTPRIAFTKQLDILRGYAHASGTEAKPVKQNELAAIVNMHPNTITMANGFFAEIGLIQKGGGGYLPAAEVINYANAYDWNTEKAGHQLAPIIGTSWFAKHLMPKLSMRSMEEDQAITDLANAALAGTEYRPHLRMLLDFLEASGLIQRDNGRITKASTSLVTPPPTERPHAQATPEPRETQSGKSTVTTSFSQPTEGVVRFNVSVRVDMAEFAGWKPDRIAAFFQGIAQVLAAKGSIEKDASMD